MKNIIKIFTTLFFALTIMPVFGETSECSKENGEVKINGVCKAVLGYTDLYGNCENEDKSKCLSNTPGTFSAYNKKNNKVETFNIRCTTLEDKKDYCECELPGKNGQYVFKSNFPHDDCKQSCAIYCQGYAWDYHKGHICNADEYLYDGKCIERTNKFYPEPYACTKIEKGTWNNNTCVCPDDSLSWESESHTCIAKKLTSTISPATVNASDIKIQKPKELTKEELQQQQDKKKAEEKKTCEENSLSEWKDDKCVCKAEDQEWDGFDCACKDPEKVIENGKCVKEKVDKAVVKQATKDFNTHVVSLKNTFETTVKKYKSECDNKHGLIKDGICQEPEKNNRGNE